MNYIEITIATADSNLQEIITAVLAEHNFDGFETSDENLKAFISEDNFREDELREILQPFAVKFCTNIIKKQNWNALWESNFNTVLVDDFVGVRAHFHEPIQNVKHEIIITPKMSFGTGHHATTYTVMQLMKEISFTNKTVFDFGTGTGILAILAEKLGAAKVLAIDNDDWCIENSMENITNNNCYKITIEKADKAAVIKTYDIVIANINKNIILDNIQHLAKATTAKGSIILSGLLIEDEQDIVQAFENLQFKHQITKEKNGWIALLMSKQ